LLPGKGQRRKEKGQRTKDKGERGTGDRETRRLERIENGEMGR
jgi:hypothetical protein